MGAEFVDQGHHALGDIVLEQECVIRARITSTMALPRPATS